MTDGNEALRKGMEENSYPSLRLMRWSITIAAVQRSGCSLTEDSHKGKRRNCLDMKEFPREGPPNELTGIKRHIYQMKKTL